MELPASGRRALEREEAKVRQGKQMRWPQIKKCQKQGRTVVFLEESGLSEPTPHAHLSAEGTDPAMEVGLLSSSYARYRHLPADK
jgi:hypothetical protein